MTAPESLLDRAIRRTGWALSLGIVLLLLQSALWSDRVPWALTLFVAGTAILAALRPADALLVVAGFVPLSYAMVVRVWGAWPFGLGEALTLAFLAGYLWHQRRLAADERPPHDGLVFPAYALVLIVVASALVQIVILQVWQDYPLKYFLNFVRFLATEYLVIVPDRRPWIDGRGFTTAAAMMVEGVALLLCARTLCRQQPALARRLTTVIIAAGVVAAALSWYQLTVAALDSPRSMRGLIRRYRWSTPAIPALNISAPYFALIAFLAVGTAIASKSYRTLKLLGAVVCLGSMWLTKTRAATVATLAVATAAGGWLWFRNRQIKPLHAVLLVALGAVAVSVLIVVFNPLQILHRGGSEAIGYRILFAETALRMIATRPILGVGMDQYYSLSGEFSPPDLLRVYRSSNAHNQFLRVAAELGLVGLAIYVWLLGAALTRIYSRLREEPIDYWFLGVAAGLSVLLITWLSREIPYPQVAFTFWILLGAAVAYATPGKPGAAAVQKRPAFARAALVLGTIALAVSVPIRIRSDIASRVDMAEVTYGVYARETDGLGTPFQWIGPRATFFMSENVRSVVIPIAAVLNPAQREVDVEILVSDRPAHRMTLTDKNWHPVELNAPADGEPHWRVEIRVSPSWVPGDTLPGSTDRRELGVRVGVIDRVF